MRRIATLAATLAALLLGPAGAQAGELTDACRATDAALLLQGPCRGAEQLASAVAFHCRRATGDDERCSSLPLAPRVIRAGVAAHASSWLHRALAYQYELGATLPLLDTPWAGTHNSFNAVRQTPALSETDANQQLTLTEQLRLDIRALELDVHSTARTHPVVCHGQGEGLGCTTERGFVAVVKELRRWLDDHRDQVLLLYLEDHLRPAHERWASERIQRHLRVLPSKGRDLATLTRARVREAGKQVVLVGGRGTSGYWRDTVFHWDPVEWEDRPRRFADCRNAGAEPPPYASRIVRFYEDSTWLTQQAELAGQSRTDDGLQPGTVRAMVACGVDLFGFDQVVPGDARLDALVWSWAEGEEPAECALLRADGRWLASDCSGVRRAACRAPGGGWVLTGPAVARPAARSACRAAGGELRPPRTGAENAALAALTDDEVWLGI